MTVPGLGGQQPAPLNSAPAAQLVPGVQPGVTGQIVASRVIIIGTGGELLVYSPSAGAGNLIASIAGAAGTDPFGNAVQAGVTAYGSAGIFAQMINGGLEVQGATGQFSPGLFTASGVAGEVAISSGLATGVDSTANIIVDSSVASGVGTPSIFLQAAQTTLNTTASTVTPSPNVNPGHQSSAPAAYSQSYEQASTNRINQIMDVLVQTGVWHT